MTVKLGSQQQVPKVHVTVRLPQGIMAELRRLAKRHNLTLTEVLTRALDYALNWNEDWEEGGTEK